MIEETLKRVQALQGQTVSLREFIGGVALAEQAKKKNDTTNLTLALSRIQSGAAGMAKIMDQPEWKKRLAQPTQVAAYVFILAALKVYAAKPTEALVASRELPFATKPAPGTTPAATGRPIGYAIGQAWADLAVEVASGEWTEARKRRAANEAAIAALALGPLGIFVALQILDGPFDLGISQALGLDELQKQAETASRYARYLVWGLGGAVVLGVGYGLYRATRAVAG